MNYFTQQLPRQLVLSSSALMTALLLSACGGGSATPPDANDKTPPTVQISDNVADGVTATGDVTFTVTASEPLSASSFVLSDLVITGGTAGAFTLTSATTATLVVIPTPNSTGTITLNLPAGSITDLAGNALAIAPTQASQAYNTIPVATPGNTGNCTTTASVNCLTIDESSLVFTPFGNIVIAESANDPVNAANKVLKIVKPSPSEPWAGVTIATTAANNSIARFGLSTNEVVTLRVYSPAAGLPILLKLENAADGGANIEKSVSTTVANAWETLTFDYTGFNANTVYNKVSVFPNFNTVEKADATYYFDELKYTIGTAPVEEVVPPVTTKLVYSSNYSATASEQGGTTGRYADDANVASPWDGVAATTDTIRSFYFGYHMNTTNKAWGFGGFVKAPNNGTAVISNYTNAALTVWGNSELFETKPTLTVLLIGPSSANCAPKLLGTITASSIDATQYTVAKSSLKVDVACPSFDTVDTIWNGGVNEVHVQVLESTKSVQYVKSTSAGFPNGLNIGPITFQ